MPSRGKHRPDRGLSTRAKRLVAVPLVFALMTGVAWAYWTTSSVPGGNGASAATSVNQGATPTASATGAAVTVSWAATTLTSGQAVSGYTLKRYDAVTPFALQTILTACTGTIATTSCVENSVPNGSWQYTVTPTFATNWVGAASAKSIAVVVSVAAPVVTATGSTLAYTENGTTTLDSGITVTDADSANLSSATVSMTTAYVNGQDSLAFTNQNGITGTWTAATGVLALTGSATVANYQIALRSITYNNNSNAPDTTTRTVTFVANDGNANSTTASRTITLTAVNNAPVNSVPGAQTTATSAAKVFSSGNSNLISVSDADSGASSVQVQLVSTNGTTTLSGVTGLTFTVGDGTADTTMTFTGTVTNVNLRLAGLGFTPTTSGAASLQIVTSDQGNTGTGGTLTDNDTIAITVDYGQFTNADDIGAVNGAPSSSYASSVYTEVGSGDVSGVSGTSDSFHYLYKSWTGDGTILARVTALTNSDVLAVASVMFRETTAVGSKEVNEGVSPVSGNGSRFGYRSTTDATTTNSSTAGLAPTYWVKLSRAGNTFTGSTAPDSSGSPGTWTQRGSQSVTMASTILVGLATSAHTASATTTGTYDNVSFVSPPVLTPTGSTLAYTENGTPTLDSAITATSSTTNLASATVTMTTAYVNGQDSLAFTNQNGITGTWTAATGVLALTGSATLANYQSALRSITYNNNSDAPDTTTRTVTFVANDGLLNSSATSRTITLTAVNDAPVNSIPGAQSTARNTAKVFSSGNGNLISVSDVDAAAAAVQVQLVSTSGTTTLSGVSGLTFTVGDGTADTTMTFTGTLTNVNLRLAGLSFTPTASGAASLQIITSDQGNTGTGGTLTDNDTVAITVAYLAYVVNQTANTVTPVNVTTGIAGTAIAVGSTPYDVAITPDGTKAYVVNFGSNTVTPITVATGVAGTPITVGSGPTGVAFTPDGTKAYVTNRSANTVTPITVSTNTAGTAFAVGNGPWGVAFSPNGTKAYVCSFLSNIVTPITVATNTAGSAITVGSAPAEVAFSPDGTKAYVANWSSATVTPITVATNTAGSAISVGTNPAYVAITPDGSKAYVTNASSNSVTPITVSSNTPGTAINVGSSPRGVAFTSDGTKAYVSNSGSTTVTPITVSSNTAGSTITVGNAPWGVAMVP